MGDSKLAFDEITIPVGFIDILRGPVQMVSDKDISGNSPDVLFRMISVKRKTHSRTALFGEKAQLEKVGAKMKVLAELLIGTTDSLRGFKISVAFPVFSS